MISYKSPEEIQILREGGKRLHEILYRVADLVVPGVTTLELDQVAEKLILEAGGIPSFKNYGEPPYPASLCTSVNDEVVHGIPKANMILQEGDIIGLDIGMKYPAKGGLHTDMAITVGVGRIDKEAQRLINVTRESLVLIEKNAGVGVDWQYLSRLAQDHIEKNGFGVVRSLVGHGVGYEIHEDPQLPNYVMKHYHLILKEGMVIACEPMVTMGDYTLEIAEDDWTYVTADKSLSAHFENSLAITNKGTIILTGE